MFSFWLSVNEIGRSYFSKTLENHQKKDNIGSLQGLCFLRPKFRSMCLVDAMRVGWPSCHYHDNTPESKKVNDRSLPRLEVRVVESVLVEIWYIVGKVAVGSRSIVKL